MSLTTGGWYSGYPRSSKDAILITSIATAMLFCKLSQATGWDGVGTNNNTYLMNVEQECNALSWV